jgi:hypothetical protein
VLPAVDRGRRQPFGCSVIGLRRGPREAPIASQNMDTPAYYAGTQVLHEITGQGPVTTVLAYAGSTGLCGFNDAGVSICCNAMLTLPNATHGLPVNCPNRSSRCSFLACSSRWRQRVRPWSRKCSERRAPEGRMELRTACRQNLVDLLVTLQAVAAPTLN